MHPRVGRAYGLSKPRITSAERRLDLLELAPLVLRERQMPSHETQAGTLWPTLALTASLCRGRARPRQRNSAFQPGVEAAHRPGRRHHCDHSRISPTAPHPAG
jgi:hypothetical protein